MTLDLAVINALNAHANRLYAAIYTVNNHLNKPLEPNTESLYQYTQLFKQLQHKAPQDNPKFPHLTVEKATALGTYLRYPAHVLHHVVLFQNSAIKTLRAISASTRAFDLSWNYVFVRPVLTLLTNYVKITIFANSIKDIDKVCLLYEYAYKKVANCEIPIIQSISCFNDAGPNKVAATFKLLEYEFKNLYDAIYPMFKAISATITRILGVVASINWPALDIYNNPQLLLESEQQTSTFFKYNYLVLMDLHNLIEWFYCYSLLSLHQVASDQSLYDLLKLIFTQQPVLEMHGEYVIFIKEYFDVQRKAFKMSNDSIDTSGFESAAYKDTINNRILRRLRLTMIINECLNAGKGDSTLLADKFPLVLAILGFANYEIRSTLAMVNSNRYKDLYGHCFIALVSSTYRLVTYVIKAEEVIRRFHIYNLHEYDGPFLASLVRSFNIPQEQFEMLQQFIQAMKSINIQKYDQGIRYDLTGLLSSISTLMTMFNKYSSSHGILHLSPLFNLISCNYFHVKAAISPAQFVLEACPLHKYWFYIRNSFEKMLETIDHPNAYYIPCLFGLAHYFSLDTDTLAESNTVKMIIEQFVSKSLSVVSTSITKWGHEYFEYLNQLSEQENNSALTEINMNQAQNDQKANARRSAKKDKPKSQSNPLEDMMVGQESNIENRHFLTPISVRINLIVKTLNLVHEIGTIEVFGNKNKFHEKIVASLNNFIPTIFENMEFQAPQLMLKFVENSKVVMQLAMGSCYVNPTRLIKDNIEQLIQANIRISDKLVFADSATKPGNITKIYFNFFSTYLKEHITTTVYSPIHKSFIPLNQTSTFLRTPLSPAFLNSIVTPSMNPNKKKDVMPQSKATIISISFLVQLYKLIGIKGMALIDIEAASIIGDIFNSLNDKCAILIPADDRSIPQLDPSQVEEIMEQLCHAGSLLMFRRLLRDAIDVDSSDLSKIDEEYHFMARDLNPVDDLILQTKINSASFISTFNQVKFPLFFAGLLAAGSYWEHSHYIVEFDAFSDNSHLLSLVTDAISAASINKDKNAPVEMRLKKLLLMAFAGIQIASEERKKGSVNNSLEMFILLDQFVKNSYYANYSMLEQIVPYQFIRSIYTLLLRDSNQ